MQFLVLDVPEGLAAEITLVLWPIVNQNVLRYVRPFTPSDTTLTTTLQALTTHT